MSDFRTRIFLHSVPLAVHLPPNLRLSPELDTLHILARGIAYPALVIAQVFGMLSKPLPLQHFQLLHNNTPVRETTPISALASLHDSPIHLTLTASFVLPEGSLPGTPYNLIQSTRQSYQSLLKASDALRFGSTRRTTSLGREETLLLFDLIVACSLNVHEFWRVFGSLIDPPASGSNEKWAKVGCMFYLPGGNEVSMDGAPIALTLSDHLQNSIPSLTGAVTFHSNGIDLDGDENIGWLGTNLVDVDGWIRIILRNITPRENPSTT